MTQEKALEIMKAGHNVFLTGSAGSGKTFLLNRFISYLRENDIKTAVTASTGIAATHIEGRTIHSWAGIGIKDEMSEKELKRLSKNEDAAERIRGTKVLIIDEISMLDAKRLDLVDKVCRFFNQPFLPFGGLQVVLCGDFFQLPPVSNGEKAYFAYDSYVWQEADMKVCYLKQQFRQSDRRLSNILNKIRNGQAGEKEISVLKARIEAKVSGEKLISKLYTHNIDVDAINMRELDKLSGEGRNYQAEKKGIEELADNISKTYLVPENLRLKIGALVMFVKNNFDAGYANGTLGKVISFGDTGYPIVETWGGDMIEAVPATWNLEDDDGEVIAGIRQLPLRLAWAITVHKSQGMSLDAAEIDLSKPFAPGMGYVALSRVRSLDGVRLIGIAPFALKIDPQVTLKDSDFKKLSDKAERLAR